MIENIYIPRPTNGHTYKFRTTCATPNGWTKITIMRGSPTDKRILKILENWGNRHLENEEYLYHNALTFKAHNELYAKDWHIFVAGT